MTICPSCGAGNDDAADACFTCGKALSSLVKGAVLGSRYEILSPLGKGGMGLVYKAYDRELEETVALKVLRADLGQGPEMARRFRSEIKLARKVRHRNVCAIHEFGQAGPLLFIAMELIDGLDLKHVLTQRGALPPAQGYDLAAQIADGLQAIHDEGIIHRDLKTTNIMVDERGVVRLMDFGIAKQWQAEGGVTGTGQIVGTPEYMSPEQVRGDKLDFRSDIYSLGIVVFELFMGRVPFRGDTPAAVILKHLQEPPPLDDASTLGLPRDAIPILRKALAKNPVDRFQKARIMAQVLRQARARAGPQTASTAVPMPTATIGLPSPTRTRPRAALLGLAATALLVAAAVAYRSPSPSRLPMSPAASAPAALTTPSTLPPAAPPPQATGGPPATLAESRSPALKAAQAAFSRGDYDAAVRQAQAALGESGNGEAQKVLARAQSGQKAAHYIRAAEAALEQGDHGEASKQAEAARVAAPWDPRLTGLSSRIQDLQQQKQRQAAAQVNDLLDRAEKALESKKPDVAVGLYDEVLKLDPQSQVARMGRLTAISSRAAAQPAGVAPAPAKTFVAGKTLAQSAETRTAGAAPPGFEPSSGIAVSRSTQAAALPGHILFEVEPQAVKPGDKYTIRIVFVNGGSAPIEIRTMRVTTIIDGGKSSDAVPPRSKLVAPGQKALLLSTQGVWKDEVKSWSMEVAVYTAQGETYKNGVTWK